MNAEMLEVSREVSLDEIAHAGHTVLREREEEARSVWVEVLRAEALGCIWPSVVVRYEPYAYGARVTVRGQAFRFGGL